MREWPPEAGEMAARIAAFDWASTSLGSIDAWPQHLKMIVELMVSNGFPMVVLWGTELIQIYNDGFRLIMRNKHPGGLGQPTCECWPEVWHINEPIYRRVWAGETLTFEDGLYPLTRSGRLEDAWFTLTYSPVRDGSGTIGGVLVTLVETTKRLLAERAQAESERRFRALATAGSYVIYRMSPDWRQMYVLEGRDFLADTSEPADNWADAYILEEDRPPVFAAISQAIQRQSVFELEHRVRRLDGSIGWTLSRAVPILGADGEVVEWFGTATDVTARKQAELALRDNEERQQFLLQLSDTLRAEPDADVAAVRAIRLLAEQMKLDRCFVTSMHVDEGRVEVSYQYRRVDLAPLPLSFPIADLPALICRATDRTIVIQNAANEAELSRLDKQNIASVGLNAFIAASLRRGDHSPVWAMVAASTQPRQWTPTDIALVEDVVERTWATIERARAETALRQSEARFRQFAEASSGALWIRDATTLSMEYVSPAIATIYGVAPDAFVGDIKRWAAAIIPEDRVAALDHIEQAKQGHAVVHEFRIQRATDRAFRWIRDIAFPLLDEHGRVQRIGGIAEDATEGKLSVEHQGVLLAELQHRVRNIMAITRSIAARTAQRAESVPDYANLMVGRLVALARVQALLTRAANVGVGVRTIVQDEVGVQAAHENQYDVDGPDVELSPKAGEILTLAIHELATNAVKHGALAVPSGKVVVRWTTFDKAGHPWLGLDWSEHGVPIAMQAAQEMARRRGFGSELIEGRIPYELGGRGKLVLSPEGAACRLEFPLQQGASILETDAPLRGSVSGGELDMTAEADLSGQRVLVLEDDYFLASDTSRALQGAGADVLGPCATEQAARDQIARTPPTAAVVDINLGHGASFDLARTLKEEQVPMVFVTGYDAANIPLEFAGTARLQKPVELRHIVSAVARAVGLG